MQLMNEKDDVNLFYGKFGKEQQLIVNKGCTDATYLQICKPLEDSGKSKVFKAKKKKEKKEKKCLREKKKKEKKKRNVFRHPPFGERSCYIFKISYLIPCEDGGADGKIRRTFSAEAVVPFLLIFPFPFLTATRRKQIQG